MTPTSIFVKSNNINLHLREWSTTGTPLLLIHGITSSGQTWSNIAPHFVEEYRVLAVDLRGHGQSSKPTAGYNWENDYGRDIFGLIETYLEEPPIIIGHSLGASVTAAVAVNLPRQVKAVILEDPPAFVDDDLETLRERFATTLDTKALPFEEKVKSFMEGALQGPPKTMPITREAAEYKSKNLEDMADAVITELRKGGTTYKAESVFPRISCPCLVMLGDPSLGGVVELKHRNRLNSILKTAKILELPDVGHGVHSDAEKDFVRFSKDFIASLD
ncbi:MAG: alpha/beta hydrolase [Chloroflexota bacterium]|nr:alpha/beta hydrolase [Chloroflexota bacterium]